MQNITVDLSGTAPSVSSQYGGEIGEHQAVTLKVIPETAMSRDEDIAFYYILFKVSGGLVSSRTYNVGEEITCALWDQLTALKELQFQLIGTNGEETIVAKSPIITLYLGDSLDGTVIGIDDNRDSLIAMIGAFNERLSGDETKINQYEIMRNSHEAKEYGQTIWEMYKSGSVLNMSILNNPVAFISYRVDGSRIVCIYAAAKESETNAVKFVCYSVPLDSTTVTRLGYTSYTLTPAEKEKLDAISTGTIADGDTGYVIGGDVFTALSGKQDTLTAGANITIENNVISATGGGASVQSDWNQSDSDAPDYIKNKPDLSVYAESSELSAVATSGSYNDLENKPTIPAAQVQADWNESDSSSKAYILNKPTIPTVPVTDVQNASGSSLVSDGVATIPDPTIPVTDVQDQNGTSLVSGGIATITNNGGFIAQSSAPSDTSLLWIDTDDNTIDETLANGDTSSY